MRIVTQGRRQGEANRHSGPSLELDKKIEI